MTPEEEKQVEAASNESGHEENADPRHDAKEAVAAEEVAAPKVKGHVAVRLDPRPALTRPRPVRAARAVARLGADADAANYPRRRGFRDVHRLLRASGCACDAGFGNEHDQDPRSARRPDGRLQRGRGSRRRMIRHSWAGAQDKDALK